MSNPAPNQRVSLITLGVANLARSIQFYRDLGWSPHARSLDDICLFQMNGFALALYEINALADDQKRPVTAIGTGAITLAQNFDSEAEVDASFERAIAAGATTIKKPEKAFWGGYSGYIADPDGHIWELAMNPNWPLSEDGSLILPDPK
ncbi:VOC family protein [Maritalea myrionectae]|uniref:VOC family protein n=1 Tax=Maritalea myrionectae TaxID=454601 RepID=UPI000413546D|nr:VOC family protein [Maritalea myrionectae]